MNKKILALIITGALLIISLVFNVLLTSAVREAQSEGEHLQKEKERLESKLEASKENNEKLKVMGEKFVKTMFTFDNQTASDVKGKLLEQVKGKARSKLQEVQKTTESYEISKIEAEYSSSVKIKESYFNRIDEDSSLVTIVFDQALTVGGNKTVSQYEMKVWLEHFEGEWSVENYELQQLL
ncbi:hypothetical protein [Halobacillus naozhouensis]|uniref:Uncharacterized protein n=1 Tax=Halobacillus naozhouensis TaxID=554880 RepID=A0ABY8J4W0_9BACI|nr:hypothetical protein [Halobacillus naozhouensis]WFT77101.1 hypothetical protein P9989_21455 [Halobacillus naozhouensis]